MEQIPQYCSDAKLKSSWFHREERGEFLGEVNLPCKPRVWATYQAQFGN